MATSMSGIWMTRAIAGSTVCKAVLPAATVSSTANSTANSRRGKAICIAAAWARLARLPSHGRAFLGLRLIAPRITAAR